MTTEEKRIQMIEFSGKAEDWERWSESFWPEKDGRVAKCH